jgi:DNA-binding NarL/FixJ family response regulator
VFRILLADDNPRVHELVRSLLEAHFEVMASVHDGRALIEAVTKFRPDVIVTDISMPLLNGIEAANQLKESGSGARVVFLTVHEDPDFIKACLATGALGYVTKPRMALDLIPAIQEALHGRTFVSAASSNGCVQHLSERTV